MLHSYNPFVNVHAMQLNAKQKLTNCAFKTRLYDIAKYVVSLFYFVWVMEIPLSALSLILMT